MEFSFTATKPGQYTFKLPVHAVAYFSIHASISGQLVVAQSQFEVQPSTAPEQYNHDTKWDGVYMDAGFSYVTFDVIDPKDTLKNILTDDFYNISSGQNKTFYLAANDSITDGYNFKIKNITSYSGAEQAGTGSSPITMNGYIIFY